MPRSILLRLASCGIALLAATVPAWGAKPAGGSATAAGETSRVVESAPIRWSAGGSAGTPDFTRHVMPLLSKLGCANRACHGSFQGQNGFRLSLFAHDPKLDFTELADDGGKSRIDPANPAQSLALLKPTGAVDHEGGELIEKGSWQYRILHDWIASKPHFDPGKPRVAVERVELSPAETRLKRTGSDPVKLRMTAWFSDGTQEDVTPLTIFTTNDETVVDVDEAGTVTAKGPGDTAVVGQYAGVV